MYGVELITRSRTRLCKIHQTYR